MQFQKILKKPDRLGEYFIEDKQQINSCIDFIVFNSNCRVFPRVFFEKEDERFKIAV